jgi:hypothetical protein
MPFCGFPVPASLFVAGGKLPIKILELADAFHVAVERLILLLEQRDALFQHIQLTASRTGLYFAHARNGFDNRLERETRRQSGYRYQNRQNAQRAEHQGNQDPTIHNWFALFGFVYDPVANNLQQLRHHRARWQGRVPRSIANRIAQEKMIYSGQYVHGNIGVSRRT